MVNPRAREHEGAIPKTKLRQPPESAVKPDVREEISIGEPIGSQPDFDLLSSLWGDFGGECPKSNLHPLGSSESAVHNAAGDDVQNESHDTGFFSGECNPHSQMTSLSTTPDDTPVVHASSDVPVVGKTEHRCVSLTSLSARPTTVGAPLGEVIIHYNNRLNQNDPVEVDFVPEKGEETGRPVEHCDATENNGCMEELLQESRLQCTHLQAAKDCLQVENEELMSCLEEQKLLKRILEENHLMRLFLATKLRSEARRVADVASGGSSAAIEEDNASDNNSEEFETDVNEQPGPFPQESEDSSDDMFYDARNDWFM